uniref:Putative transmembrane protein n=1 Tax=Spiroplasma citri TaxID=2133 RepID=Q3ZVI9_SPICI|nr:hypothetical protein [Spiroplasma citri]CAI94299.1 putative transmembrane protein [Spiroplasma citri]
MMTLLATSGVNDLLNKILGIALPILIAIAVVSAIIMIGVYAIGGKFNADSSNRKETIKINCYELAHQDMLIKWLVVQTDIEHYQTERELKIKNGNLNAYPDLIITKNDDSEIYVEFERTQKSPSRFKKKLDGHTKWLRNGGQIYWITPTQTLANWIQRQIDKDDFKTELQQVIIWPTHELNTYEIWNNKE